MLNEVLALTEYIGLRVIECVAWLKPQKLMFKFLDKISFRSRAQPISYLVVF